MLGLPDEKIVGREWMLQKYQILSFTSTRSCAATSDEAVAPPCGDWRTQHTAAHKCVAETLEELQRPKAQVGESINITAISCALHSYIFYFKVVRRKPLDKLVRVDV